MRNETVYAKWRRGIDNVKAVAEKSNVLGRNPHHQQSASGFGGRMRIESIEVRNFKKFAQQAIEFHRQFTLLVGENGSGKTSILDALAVALGVWLVDVPDSDLANSRRSIDPAEIRLEPTKQGDRTLFREVVPPQSNLEVRSVRVSITQSEVRHEQAATSSLFR
ncbi:MAG: ATP-binding protein, partial [Gemmataceae bacterium]|nr:ATP-binding protein [Gemmataceae bacterium]